MSTYKKQISFDLDTNALKTYYPSESWNHAYDTIKRHMENNGFKWLQGSVYISDKPMSSVKVSKILEDLVTKNPWLNVCMRDCRESNIGREHSKNHLFDENAKVPTREELNAQKNQEQKQQDSKQMSMGDYMAEIAKAKEADKSQPSQQQQQKVKDKKEKTDR